MKWWWPKTNASHSWIKGQSSFQYAYIRNQSISISNITLISIFLQMAARTVKVNNWCTPLLNWGRIMINPNSCQRVCGWHFPYQLISLVSAPPYPQHTAQPPQSSSEDWIFQATLSKHKQQHFKALSHSAAKLLNTLLLSLCLSLSLSICLSVCLSVSLSLSLPPSFCLFLSIIPQQSPP